jgi:uncharacterized protein YcbK (DUF882 family)
MNWEDYPNFTPEEFACSHTGEVNMDIEFMEKLQQLRNEFGRPMKITSGYRSPTHPIEAAKDKPGAHTMGKAADIALSGREAYVVVKLAYKYGFTGIGVKQDESGRFVHLDTVGEHPRPNLWSY